MYIYLSFYPSLSLYMCMYVCMYVCIYIYIYIYTTGPAVMTVTPWKQRWPIHICICICRELPKTTNIC